MNLKRGISLLVTVGFTCSAALEGLAVTSYAESSEIQSVSLSWNDLACGTVIADGTSDELYLEVMGFIDDIYDENIVTGDTFAVITGLDAENAPELYSGTITGENEYKVYIVIRPAEGYTFSDDADVECDGDTTIISQASDHITITGTATAEHVDPYDENSVHTEASCTEKEYTAYTCSGCGEHFETIGVIDPEKHSWNEWEIITPATATQRGEWSHSCALCGTVDAVGMPMLYSSVYEPATSVSMAPTIAWRADSSAVGTAAASVRPATAFVWLDADLKVYDRNGGVISGSLSDYLEATAATVIPALYVNDAATAAALKSWLTDTGFNDCFVVSTPENKDLVKDVADLVHVRGMLDFTSVKSPTRKQLTDMIASTNGAHGKIILISAEAASRDNVSLLRSLGSTVWVKTPTDAKTIMAMYTRGVNGVLVDDYKAAVKAVEFFNDDAPTLLKLPFIIGHRGDPSNYPENTLESAGGAYSEGADSVENDIHLTKDGQLYIRHDESLRDFLDSDLEDAMTLTLDELQSMPFKWTGENGLPTKNEVNAGSAYYGRYFGGKLYGEEEQADIFTPSFRQFLEEFKGKDIVHDTELKMNDPGVVPAFKALVDEYDAWDQVFTITFNEEQMQQIYDDYPEISVGSLGPYIDTGRVYGGGFASLDEVTQNSGSPEIALEMIYAYLDRFNATYNPAYIGYGYEAVNAGRHRGLTVWLWTYILEDGSSIARDYLRAVDGMTTDEAWFASDLIEMIESENTTAEKLTALTKPIGITKKGDRVTLAAAEAVKIEDLSDSKLLAIWRYKADMNIDGESFGSYYLYSEPFVVDLVPSPASNTGDQTAADNFTVIPDNNSDSAAATDSDTGINTAADDDEQSIDDTDGSEDEDGAEIVDDASAGDIQTDTGDADGYINNSESDNIPGTAETGGAAENNEIVSDEERNINPETGTDTGLTLLTVCVTGILITAGLKRKLH